MIIDQLKKVSAPLSRILSRGLIPFALIVFVAPFVGLVFCASLSVDDVAKAILARPGYICVSQHHVLSVAWSEYTMGSGRWLSSVLESAAMSKLNLATAYGWLLLLVMLSNVAALSYFFRGFLRVSRTNAFLAASVFYAAWLASLAFPGESVFWLTSVMEYQLPITAMLILAGLLCKSRHSIFSYLALAILSIAIPAEHEIGGVFLLVCLLGGIIGARALKLQVRPWLLCFGLTALGVAAIMLSPGMALKMVGGHAAQGYVTRILPHARQAVEHGVDWVLSPTILLAAVCIPFLLWARGDVESEFRPPRWLALAGIGAIGVLLAEYANAEMASGLREFPPRVVGWFQFVFCVLLICVIFVGVPEISKLRLSNGSRIVAFALFALSLLASGNFHQAERDLRGPARSWHRSNVARLFQTGSVVQFDALPPKPIMFIETGLSKNTGCWVNKCMAVYLKADVVSLKGPKENHWDRGNPCDPDPLVK